MTWECFWTDPLAQKMFKAHMLKMVSRVNTVNGRLWRCVPSAPAAPADLRAKLRAGIHVRAATGTWHK